MAVDCTGYLTEDIIFDCGNVAVAGIEQNVVLINQDDINYALTTFDATNPVLITNLVLKATKVGILLKGVKQSNGKAYELVKKENAPDKYKHTFTGVIFSPSAENKLQASNMSLGSRYIVVVEQKWKGEANADAFEVLGVRSGLELATMTNNSKENDNMILFELSSADGFEEPTLPATLLDTDYSTTKTAFDNKFIGS